MSEQESEQPVGSSPNVRRSKVRRKRRCIVAASAACLFLIPTWGFLRLFFCWQVSRSGIIFSFCDLHWLIIFLLLGFLLTLVLMAVDLIKTSKESGKSLPSQVESPWIPGTKTVAAATRVVSKGVDDVAAKYLASSAANSPGSKTVQAGAKLLQKGATNVQLAGQRFEHGRTLLGNDRPAVGTLIFTVLAFLAALFLVFSPFSQVFFL